MSIFNQVKEKVTQYIDVRLRLIKLDVIEGTSKLLGLFVFGLICLFIVFCTILFIGLGIAEGLMQMEISKLGAYFITTGIYIVLLVLIVVLRKSITRSFGSMFIKELTAHDAEKEEDFDE
jgi:Putative Actinobacterial Holin-X, holin superfamily III